MADEGQPSVDWKRIIELAYDPSKPSHYANIFYVDGTQHDVRIAFGTLRSVEYGKVELAVDKFDVSITLPHSVARDLIRVLTDILSGAKP